MSLVTVSLFQVLTVENHNIFVRRLYCKIKIKQHRKVKRHISCKSYLWTPWIVPSRLSEIMTTSYYNTLERSSEKSINLLRRIYLEYTSYAWLYRTLEYLICSSSLILKTPEWKTFVVWGNTNKQKKVFFPIILR